MILVEPEPSNLVLCNRYSDNHWYNMNQETGTKTKYCGAILIMQIRWDLPKKGPIYIGATHKDLYKIT